MKKLIILDKTDNTIYIKNYDLNEWDDILEFLTEFGFIIDSCEWMLVDKVNIDIE